MKKNRLKQAITLLVCFIMMLAVSISRDGKIFGKKLNSPNEGTTVREVIKAESDGTTSIYTYPLAKNVIGFGGAIPLKISLLDNTVTGIAILDNDETPSFINEVEQQLLPSYINRSIDEILSMNIDAVSGATYSSEAVIESIRRGLTYAQGADLAQASPLKHILNLKFLIALLVTLAAAILPFFIHSKTYRLIQLVLNVLILGFWSGSFISYTLMISYISNGVKLWTSIIPIILLIIVFIYPLFGKKNYYCTWACPFGSLQELAGKCSKRKIQLSPKLTRGLTIFRQALWAVLMILLWSGVCSSWIGYEPFSAFMYSTASYAVIAIAATFIVLSIFVARPYCRFVCPTGTLVKIAQNTDSILQKKKAEKE